MSRSPVALSRTSLSHVALRTPDVGAAARFYAATLGLTPSGLTPEGGLTLAWGTGHHPLELHTGDTGLAHVAFSVEDDGGHLALGERLAALGVAVNELADEQATIEVRDPDGNAMRFHGPVDRCAEFVADTGRRPVRVQHVTYGTANLEPMVDFYETLGFRLTDRMGAVFAWLRSNTEHHSVAVVDVGHSGRLDHYSFDLSSWKDFKIWADRLTDIGVPVQWGPGRHGPGNNLFLFFDDPDGNHVELSAEMERFFDDRARYAPRLWDADPKTINLWGGQLPQWRHATQRP
jgi:catechol 2,3-dioxygenase